MAYGADFRRDAIARMRAGHSVLGLARELGVSDQTLWRWKKQDVVDRGEQAGIRLQEHVELLRAKRRIRELETELALIKRASELFAEGKIRPKRKFPVIAALA